MIKTMKTIKLMDMNKRKGINNIIIGCAALILIGTAQAGPSTYNAPGVTTAYTSAQSGINALIVTSEIRKELKNNGQRVIGTEVTYINKDVSVIAIKSVKDYSPAYYYRNGY
jgi:hypothetical protein